MGTPLFAVPALRALVEAGHHILGAVTQPDRPKGRGRRLMPSPVKEVACEYGIEVLQPEKASAPAFCEIIRGKNPDLIIVVAFGQILKRSLLDIPGWGAINIHASLLPKYRGAAPIHWAILNDENETGLTAIRMDEGMDTGPILMQEAIPIMENETAGHLHDRLARLSGDFLLRTLEGLIESRLREVPQDHRKASYTGKIDRSMSVIQWDQPAKAISAFMRALDPWPGAMSEFRGRNIKFFSPKVLDERAGPTHPGRIRGCGEEGLMVETGEGLLVVRELQAPGRKRLGAAEFLRGFPMDPGALLGR